MCVVFVALVGSRLYTYKYKFRFKFNIHEVWTRQETRLFVRSSGSHSSVRIDHFSLIVAVLVGVIVVVVDVVVVLWTWPRRYGG